MKLIYTLNLEKTNKLEIFFKMNDGGVMIILILITSFVFYKLYSVLGNSNIEDILNKKKHTNSAPNEAEMVNLENVEEETVLENGEKLKVTPEIRKVLDELYGIEKNFNEVKFIKNAANAFEYILKLFSEEEKVELKKLLTNEMYENFLQDIQERKSNKLKKHHTLISLEEPTLINAKIEDNHVSLTVEFISKQVNYFENNKHEVVKGSKSNIDTIKDTWTFVKKINSSSPIWKLEETN